MTERQILEARFVASIIAPESLIWEFREFLKDKDIKIDIYDNVLDCVTFKQSEAILGVRLSDAYTLGLDFAIHLATQPEANIAGYWGGTLPDPSVRLAKAPETLS